MMQVNFSVPSFSTIAEVYAENAEFSSIILPLSILSDPAAISTGDRIEVSIIITDIATTINVLGTVKWKRHKDIRMPMKTIPAGIGLLLDEKSVGILQSAENKTSDLSDIGEPMIAGNYIKIRKDLADKYNKKSGRISSEMEKRTQPRISITIPVEVFANNKIARLNTKNISLEGMCIETTEKMELNEELAIVFEDAETDRQFFIKAVVVRFEIDRQTGIQNGIGLKFFFENQVQQKDLMRFIIRRS